jgi:glycerate kinase
MKQRDVFVFALHRRNEAALIEVTDASLGLPAVREAAETDTGGRGLLVVDAVSEEWGLRYEDNGRKTVWARIAK